MVGVRRPGYHGESRPSPAVRCGPEPGRATIRHTERHEVGSVIKKRRKRMAKKKHRKLLKRTRIQRRRAGK